MSETFTPETQKERWLKYGLNVLLTSILVIALAVTVTYIAQRGKKRIDTTAAGDYSLKPQSINIVKNLKSPVKLVSLYTKTTNKTDEIDYAQRVADLLDEYKRNSGGKIDVEIIDPVANPTKVDDLINDVAKKYGGEVEKYKTLLDQYAATYDQIKKLTSGETAKIGELPLDKIQNDEIANTITLAIVTAQGFPKFLDNSEKTIGGRLKLKPPDYKGATDSIQQGMETLGEMVGQIVTNFAKSKDDPKVPEEIRKYMADSSPRYEQVKKLADDLATKVKSLGDLKLDDLRQSLRARDAILVMGETDMRVLGSNQVWIADRDSMRRAKDEVEIKPRFAGEQVVSTAILAISNAKKPKVVFVRPGGPPLASPGMPPFQPGGPLSMIADRLRSYNFDVLEKDLSGMYAMQAQMQGTPAQPEPSDEEIKDAIWIVLALPAGRNPMGMPPPTIAPKVLEHLSNNGSALVLFLPQVDNMSIALKDWGVDVHTDLMAAHEAVKSSGAKSGDMVEEARRIPIIFMPKDYGDHMLAKPLKSLESVIAPIMVVTTTQKAGYKVTPLLPVPNSPTSWGESDLEAAMSGQSVDFNPDKGDMPGPIFGGAAVEKDNNGGRLVVIGSLEFITNGMLNVRDQELMERGYVVSRFPGNAEFFLNSVFWLAKMEPMIAISPAAMEVSRLDPMSDSTLRAWRIGGLIVGLPGAVILAGLMVYLKRRE